MQACARGDKRFLGAVLLWGLCAFAAGGAGSAANAYPEDSVKAAFLLRFAAYVEWPHREAPGPDFVIAVLDSNDVATHLQTLAADRQLLGRPVRVRRISSVAEARDAHILYVGSLRGARLRAALRPIAERGVLVVTHDEHGLASGSAINFLIADNRLRFEVSLGAARRAQLQISSDLLSVAARVTE
jgi:hypothetical protein